MSDPAALRRSLARVEKPGRYVGGEWNASKKKPAAGDVKVALAFPDVYEIGMSYLGQKILYSLLNARRSVLAERVFAPWPDFEQELRREGLPLVSLENGIPLADFDFLGFSLLYELNYSNILTILDLAGIPLISADRDGRHPLVIAGGPAAFNPEPLAETIDLFLLGDGEEAFPEIIEAYRRIRGSRPGRAAVLRELARINGVYVPSLYAPVTASASCLVAPAPLNHAPARISKRVLKGFGKSFFPEKIVVPSLRVVFDRVAMEAARGCPQNCRFCQATSLYFPHRTKDPGFLYQKMLCSLRQTGYEDSSLSALSISDYPYLEETVKRLMKELSPEKISLSLSSLRPQGLSQDLVASILQVRKTGFTLVPEAGTERLRAVINKKLADQDIWEGLRFAFTGGWQLVKFYFMAGLPTETEEDLRGIVSIVRQSLDLGRSILGRAPRLNISLSSFIPKPHTPFQWLGMESAGALAEKQRFIHAELRRFRSVEFKGHPVETSILEGVFSRGDRRLNRVLVRAWKNGARFDSWSDRSNASFWHEAFAAEGVDPRDYLQAFDREMVLPWDHIDIGLRKSHLARELDLALKGEPSPTCGERNCVDCGGCDLHFSKKAPAPVRFPPPPVTEPSLGQPLDQMLRYRVVYAKKGQARYLSHIDLIHVLQRSFRRAGIVVRKTQGFHPKMDFSYGPALPLGMEGLREILEFKSPYLLDEKDFIARMNKSLPAGMRILRLQGLGRTAPSLHESIDGLLYSLDLKAEDFRRAWRDTTEIGEVRNAGPDLKAVKKRLEDACRFAPGPAAPGMSARGGKVFLRLSPSPGKGVRPQDIVREALGILHPAFLIRREEVVLKASPPEIDRAGRIQ